MTNTLQRSLANLLLFLSGWKIEGELSDLKKCVIIGAPHTSNWDFFYSMIYAFYFGLDIHFLMKQELFRFPFRWFFSCIGGIPINRKKSEKKVDLLCEQMKNADHYYLAMSPEGSRKAVSKWKSGFYYIAKQADVPIALGYFDYGKRVVGIGPIFYPSGNFDLDMNKILQFYSTKQAKFPQNFYHP